MSCRLFSRRQHGGLFLGTPRHSEVMRMKSFPIEARRWGRGRIDEALPRDHLDAINRAGRYTQLASGAERRDDGMHLLASTDNRVDRAGRQAFGASNTDDLVDLSDQRRPLDPVQRVEG